jgi:hypothetical protein
LRDDEVLRFNPDRAASPCSFLRGGGLRMGGARYADGGAHQGNFVNQTEANSENRKSEKRKRK